MNSFRLLLQKAPVAGLDLELARWENSDVTTVVKADDKGRIRIRGAGRGRQYLVMKKGRGWRVMPVPDVRPPKRRREWAGPQKDLTEHLQEMADLGFALEPYETGKQKLGPRRF